MTRLWLRLEIRCHWQAMLFVLLLTTVGSAAVLSAAAGARRGYTAVDRLEARTLPATVQVDGYGTVIDWAKVRALPEVSAVGTFADGMTFRVDGPVFAFAAGNPPADAEMMHTVERPVVLAGRMYDPARADEAVVTPGWVRRYGSGVGVRLGVRFYSTVQLAKLAGGDPSAVAPAGPRATVRIVGVVRSPWFNDGQGYVGSIAASPALIRAHPAEVGIDSGAVGGLVRLRNGDADLPRFQADLARITARPDLTVRALSEFSTAVRRTTTFEAAWLAGIALAAAAAAALTVGQVVRREVAGSVIRLRDLAALGATGRQLVVAAGAAPALAAGAGVLLGTATAVAGSRWFPVGLAAEFEPQPGVQADPLVLGAGALIGVLLLVAGAAVAGMLEVRAARTARYRVSAGGSVRSVTARAAARMRIPVPAATGVRFALEPGRGRDRVPSRSALLGTACGVLGMIAALTLAAGVRDALAQPARFGQNWSLLMILGAGGQPVRPPEQALARVGADPDVTGLNDLRVASGRIGDGQVATVFSYQPSAPALAPVMLSGRPPTGPGETVLGSGTAAALHAGIGDTVRLSGSLAPAGTTGTSSVPVTVTGVGFVPESPDNSYPFGAWVGGETFDRLFTGYDYRVAQVALRPGADADAAAARLTAALGPLGAAGPLGPAVQPAGSISEREGIVRIRELPLLLGGFLTALALAAVTQALLTAARRRGHELGVLRALGLTRWQTRAVLATQGLVVVSIGLAFGLPLGVALGRTVWRVVAGYYPLQYAPPLPVAGLLLAVPCALGLVLLLAALPARRAARMRVADILRAE